MRLILFIFVAIFSHALQAGEGNAEAGKALYAPCAACHGPAAGGNPAMQAPRLAHLGEAYLAAQLGKFRNGQRGGAGASATAVQMAGMAATLADDQALADVASYIATLDGAVSAATVEGDPAMGGDYYNQFCGACHGREAQGNPALNAPRLAGSDDWYLMSQLQAFREGQRGTDADDRTGKQMRMMASTLPNEQAVKDVVAFIRSLGQ
jgi:cytochrome c553